jgi:pimeloyl-ACP methyl ester carboxylesterase
LIVPENRQQPDPAGLLRLAVAIYRSPSQTPAADPLIYLHGGPGGQVVESSSSWLPQRFAPILAQRDVIVFDQRGSGLSQPSLDCPDLTRFQFETLAEDPPLETWTAQILTQRLACRDRLLAAGIDLTAYNTRFNAADARDLALALGYEQWNLYGVSYGTRLALTAMRDNPAGIRSVVLDSTAPLEIDFFANIAPHANRALETLFVACDANVDCRTAYPELRTVFFDLVDQLNQEPITVTVYSELQGAEYPMRFDGYDLVEATFDLLYISSLIPWLPRIIYEFHDDDYSRLPWLLEISLNQSVSISEGVTLSVWCHEEIPFTTVETMLAASQSLHPALQYNFLAHPEPPYDGTTAFYEMCAQWPSGIAAASENAPVVSDIPTLIVAGAFDPITPPAWGEMVAQSLTQATFLTFADVAHGVLFGGSCESEIIAAFIAAPTATLDTACAADLAVHFSQ